MTVFTFPVARRDFAIGVFFHRHNLNYTVNLLCLLAAWFLKCYDVSVESKRYITIFT